MKRAKTYYKMVIKDRRGRMWSLIPLWQPKYGVRYRVGKWAFPCPKHGPSPSSPACRPQGTSKDGCAEASGHSW